MQRTEGPMRRAGALTIVVAAVAILALAISALIDGERATPARRASTMPVGLTGNGPTSGPLILSGTVGDRSTSMVELPPSSEVDISKRAVPDANLPTSGGQEAPTGRRVDRDDGERGTANGPVPIPGDNRRLDRLVYASTREGNTDLWAANTDGTDQRRLTSDPQQDLFPDVSPDGGTIVFTRGFTSGSVPHVGQLWIMNADGTDERPLFTEEMSEPPTAEYRPDFSPDGGTILFTRHAGGVAQDLWIVKSDGTGLKRVVDNATYGHWGPDGRTIVYASDRGEGLEIFVQSLPAGVARPITSSNGVNVAPQWSPDGARIVFTSTRNGKGEVWIMNADGSDQHVVVTSQGRDGFATWSPDSRRIAFASTRHTPCPPQLAELCPHQIYTISADGTDLRRVAENAVYDIHAGYFPRGRTHKHRKAS